jgi:hypothetical protein
MEVTMGQRNNIHDLMTTSHKPALDRISKKNQIFSVSRKMVSIIQKHPVGSSPSLLWLVYSADNHDLVDAHG